MSSIELFDERVQEELIKDFEKVKIPDSKNSRMEAEELLHKYSYWLQKTPSKIFFRVNPSLCNADTTVQKIQEYLHKIFCQHYQPNISKFPTIPEVVVVDSWNESVRLNLKKNEFEIIVDCNCATALLRGSHLYAPGVLGMPKGLNSGDPVSIYADVTRTCKKGLISKYCTGKKIFIGNGLVKMSREKIFGKNSVNSGIAVHVTDVISRVPQLNDDILPPGCVLLQNLPSILCSRILDPQPGETILDMCAAPGNKTTHLASLMNGEGHIIALEKIKSKVEKLKRNVEKFACKNVQVFCFDSTKAVSVEIKSDLCNSPPFLMETFDRILLDGPCSGLGQRPQIRNFITAPQLASYVALQRKLFSQAVKLLKPNGTLVYSTCTITISENEGIIAWALKTFPELKLQPVDKKLDKFEMKKFYISGFTVDGLTSEESRCVCRFDFNDCTIGFFIACFVKKLL